MTIEEFKKALSANVVIPLHRPGALSLPETLALRSWFDNRRKQAVEAPVEERFHGKEE